ncbi:hypothetical protein D4L85_00760 [Chryseolinea soli]|uniref:Type II secretion system protein GspC N-terminal domain-containing protein n=1 Tax=Chryseolinea soli TaxID=2321403 RepID=A0A385SFJ2_9BACT|nr:hypothetical protein D4L85_00760 [Chryseolinea soli]
MDKNKKNILLITLALSIWGFIAFKIISGLESDSEQTARPMPMKRKAAKDSTKVYAFSFAYPDPFLKKKTPVRRISVGSAPSKVRVAQKTSVLKPVTSIKWERLKYKGAMYNASRKTSVASVTVDDSDYFVRQGEIVGDFMIEAIANDSIRISCSGHMHYVKREK